MRKLIFVLLICRAIFISNNSSAQGYVPFPENDAIWTLYYAYGPDVNQDRYHIYYASGDTMIGGQSYNKLYKKTTTVDHVFDGIGFAPTPGTIIYPKTYLLAYRNDSSNRMVYKINADSIIERSWYNFNLQIGDTIPNYMLIGDNGSDTIRLVDIDTINYCGSMRMKYILSSSPCYWQSPLYFISGVGNDQDFGAPYCSMGEYSGTWLECFVDYDYCGAPSNPFSACNITLGVGNYEDHFVNIYPNPTSKNLFFKESFDHIDVYDLSGNKCFTSTIVSTSIDISFLAPGIYLISAEKNGQKYFNRFIKLD